MNVKWIGAHTNNFESGRGGKTISQIVLHWIVGTLGAADATFNDGRRRASAHYGIGGQQIHQYVREQDTAYHAGNFDVNQRSIGIEHEGGPELAISEETYQTSAKLVADIAERNDIPLDREHVRMHREISATQCPGTLDIDRVIREARAILQQASEPMATITQKELDAIRTRRDELYNENQVLRETIDHLNTQVKERQAEVDQLKRDLKTTQAERDDYKPAYERLPQAEAELKQALSDRKAAWEETDLYKKEIERLKTENQQLIDQAPHAFLRWVLAKLRR